MKRENKVVKVLVAVFAICTFPNPILAITFTTLDDPLAGNLGTVPLAIDRTNIVGYTMGNFTGEHGFLYNGSFFTTIEHPSGIGLTEARGIEGKNIVGDYSDTSTGKMYGFLYDGSRYTTLDNPLGVFGTHADGISGSNIIGTYQDSNRALHGYLYDGSTYTTIDNPLATGGVAHSTILLDIQGNAIVGDYDTSASGRHGFLYDGSTYKTIDVPFGLWTSVCGIGSGIGGNNIVGAYYDGVKVHGFIFDGSTYRRTNDKIGLICFFYRQRIWRCRNEGHGEAQAGHGDARCGWDTASAITKRLARATSSEKKTFVLVPANGSTDRSGPCA